MNRVKSIAFMCQRGYARHRKLKEFIDERKIVDIKKELNPDFDPENQDDDENGDGFDEEAADLQYFHKSHNEHYRELKREHDLLKLRIVRRKYFKSTDPNFLTWSEREEMKNLHRKDSTEWTVERLSEAFPALPESVSNILRSQYQPRSVNEVKRHDERVIEAWEKFRAGELALSPKMEAHMEKFKDRRVKMPDLEVLAERFVRPEPVFPAPQSTLFTNIVRGYIEEKEAREREENEKAKELTLAQEKEKDVKNYQTQQTDVATKAMEEFISRRKIRSNTESKELVPNDYQHRTEEPDRRYATFDAYIERRVERIAGRSEVSLEDHVLMEEYKQRKNERSIDELEISNSQLKKEEKKPASVLNNPPVETVKPAVVISEKKIQKIYHSAETGIIAVKDILPEELDNEYPDYIKVPKAKAQLGYTFRVCDRYYDSDGQFLYRVPGLADSLPEAGVNLPKSAKS